MVLLHVDIPWFLLLLNSTYLLVQRKLSSVLENKCTLNTSSVAPLTKSIDK